jgi:uncharacterized glyoxalase superfamily protein PhnB
MAPSTARKAALTRKRRIAGGKRRRAAKRRAVMGKAAITRKRKPARAIRHDTASVVPMLSYEDGTAAMVWLRRAFGFRQLARQTMPDGRLAHGEMAAGDGVIMLASPTPEYQGPKRHREVCEQARKWSTVPWIIDGVLVYVDDLDRHFKRAKAAGATILSEIESDPPGRRYRAEDIEGHRWFFFEK